MPKLPLNHFYFDPDLYQDHVAVDMPAPTAVSRTFAAAKRIVTAAGEGFAAPYTLPLDRQCRSNYYGHNHHHNHNGNRDHHHSDNPSPSPRSSSSSRAETVRRLEPTAMAGSSTSSPGDLEGGPPRTDQLTPRKFLALAALSFMWSSAQAPLFLFAGAPVFIYGDLGGSNNWIWFVTAHLLAIAAISPFVGALSDIFGRRYVAITGSTLLVIGQIVCGVAPRMTVFIGGMVISGVGAGINELTALAGTAELAPVSKRGYYLASVVVSTTVPLLPSVMWAQLIAANYSWRYIAVVSGGAAFLGLFMTVVFYAPPEPASLREVHRIALVKKIDFVGGVLSIGGLACFEIGILGGGYQDPWASAQVLGPLIAGVLLLVVFVVWEIRGAKNPMVPRRLGKAPRTLVLTMVITFISGANFFSVLMLWPSEAYNVYGHNPTDVGIRGLPFAFGTLTGCILSLILLSALREHIKWILFGASCLMTAGCGALAAARVDNIQAVYAILFIAGLGVGGIIVPASTVTTIICPQDLLATITSLSMTVRIIGGVIGYAVYYNVFANKLVPELTAAVGEACVRAGITDMALIGEVIGLTAESLVDRIRELPGVDEAAWTSILEAGQRAYADVYPWAYYCSLAFGAVSILASVFLEDISEFIDDHIEVAM